MADIDNVAQDNTDATTETAETEVAESTETEATETQEIAETKETKTEEKPVVPEKYSDFELPEGFVMDKAALEEFMPLAKELGMTQEAAQKAISLHTKAIGSVMERMAEMRDAAYADVVEEVKADKLMGGAGFEQNVGRINTLFDNYGAKGEIFHQAVAQIAAVDKVAAKSLWSALDRIARDAGTDEKLIGGGSKKSDSILYPGLPRK